MAQRKENQRISIVVPAYNEAERIGRFGASVIGQRNRRGTPVSLFVSDNGSTDNTRQLAAEFGTVVTGSAPRNIGSARRVGAEAALDTFGIDPNHILLFTDADSRLAGDFTDNLLEPFGDSDIQAAYGTSRFEFSSGLVVPAPGRVLDVLRKRILHGVFASQGRDYRDYVRPPYQFLPGVNTAVRADAYEKAGGYTDFGNGADDLDFSLRLKDSLAEGAIAYNPGQLVYTSGRNYEGPSGYPSLNRFLVSLRGEHTPFQTEGTGTAESHSQVVVREYIRRKDAERYDLRDGEVVEGIYVATKVPPSLASSRRIQARNYVGRPIPGKVAVVGHGA